MRKMYKFKTFLEALANNEEESFRKHLWEHPDDRTGWGAYHDWMEDRGDPRAQLLALIMVIAQPNQTREKTEEAIERLEAIEKKHGPELVSELANKINPLHRLFRAHPNLAQAINYYGHEINEEWLQEALPTGSGLDGEWDIDEEDDHFMCHAGYHATDGNGSYCGWIGLTVRVPKHDPLEFEVEVNQQDIDAIMARYDREVPDNDNEEDDDNDNDNDNDYNDYNDYNDNIPYLDDIGDVVSETIKNSFYQHLSGRWN